VFSALGLLAADVEHHFLRTHLRLLDPDLDTVALHAITQQMAGDALVTLAEEGYPGGRAELRWSFDARYLGQSFDLSIAVEVPPDRPLSAGEVAAVADAFGRAHERTYGHRAAGEPVELVNVRLAARGIPAAPRGIAAGAVSNLAPAGAAAERAAYFGPQPGWLATPIVARAALASAPRPGPLIVEEYDATTLVPPGWYARLDGSGSIVLERGGHAATA
jgi:N-methylhydantoinase A